MTDIPSFRALAAERTVTEFWRPGDAGGLARALVAAAARPRSASRVLVRQHFDAELAVDAVGRKLCAAYRALLSDARVPDTGALPATRAT